MTKQYLNYEYDYKYNVTHNVGYYLPPISVCTQSNVFYDMNFINGYFDTSMQFNRFKEITYNRQFNVYNDCVAYYYRMRKKNYFYHIIDPVIVKIDI